MRRGFLVGLLHCGCSGQMRTLDDRVELEAPVKAVSLDAASGGHVILHGSDETGAIITRAQHYTGQKPITDAQIVSGVLILSAQCAEPQQPCAVDHEVWIPAGVSVDVQTAAGDVTLHRIRGDVAAHTGGGVVTASGLRGDQIVITSIGGPITVDAAIPPRRMALDSSDGDIVTTIPDDAYDIEAHAPTGEVQVSGVTEADQAERQLRVRAEDGNIRISGR
ncbi:MAG: hypothetical protein AAFV53_18900 [Myxococcota bacterium]